MLSILLSTLAILSVLVQSGPVIQFSFGKVQGVDKQAHASQKPYIAFYGIPFAEPPVDDLRFKPPQPFVGNGSDVVISSDNFRPACMQLYPYYNKVMDEDCLYLNVFSPTDLTKPRKVMFWIHGGGFQIGDASQYVPSQLVTDDDVIVVTTQYRLGIFGFLTSQNGDGNNGLRDQILALQWTKDNIQAFGGDPNDITIFGESAGGASVSFMSISPLTKGLFTKAIMQSGTAFSPWALNRNPSVALNSVSDKLGCTTSLFHLSWFRQISSVDKINCIKNKTDTELLGVYVQEQTIAAMLNKSNQFVPIIDGVVLPRSPDSLLADAAYLKVNGALDRDYIIGFNNNEGLLIFTKFLTTALIDNFTAAAAAEEFIRSAASAVSPAAVTDPSKLALLYYQYSYPRETDGHTSLQSLLDIVTDIMFVVPTIRFARAVSNASNSTNVYLYLFDHYPQLVQPGGPRKGSTHGLELTYEFDVGEMFQLAKFYALPPQPSEKNLTELLLTTLSQFAKTGSPVGPAGEERRAWPRYDSKDEHFFRISLSPRLDQHVHGKRVPLWTDILLKTNSKATLPARRFWRH